MYPLAHHRYSNAPSQRLNYFMKDSKQDIMIAPFRIEIGSHFSVSCNDQLLAIDMGAAILGWRDFALLLEKIKMAATIFRCFRICSDISNCFVFFLDSYEHVDEETFHLRNSEGVLNARVRPQEGRLPVARRVVAMATVSRMKHKSSLTNLCSSILLPSSVR